MKNELPDSTFNAINIDVLSQMNQAQIGHLT